MWLEWQDRVKKALPNFCESPIFVAQDIPQEQVEETAKWVAHNCPIKVFGPTLGENYGAKMFNTIAYGPVTRMWLDAMVETNFLAKHLNLRGLDVLDIGAGYGRLAAAMEDVVNSYVCTDVIPISLFVCEYFTMKYAPSVKVIRPEFLTPIPCNLAINIHSWSEASLESIAEWLAILKQKGVPYLFTVPHDDDYLSWGDGSFRPLIAMEYDLVEEVKIGLGNHPHSLWKRR